MIARLSGAALRGLLVALVIMAPALILPQSAMETSHATVLIALIAGIMTLVEYTASSPSIVEFRDASPYNRLRFMALCATVLMLSAITRGATDPTALTDALTSVGTIIGNSIDFPYSPVRLAVLMLPPDTGADTVQAVRTAAGLAYLTSLTAMAVFLFLVRVLGWPSRSGAFNVWVNLPLFDPTGGGDVLHRLNRDARVNIALGFLLPFVIPAVVKLAADLIDPSTLTNPQTLIWTMCAWALLPASMIMRGIALHRIAEMIRDQRQRAYSSADDGDLQIA